MLFYFTDAQKKIGYNFKNAELLRRCFTHSSYANEHKGEICNERLEFLGDSVLGLIVTEYLYKLNRDSEGGMTFTKQSLVSTKPLADATRRLKVEEYLLIGGDETRTRTDKVCENLYESIVGGIYLDGGFEEAKKFVMRTLITVLKNDSRGNAEDYKSKLNEFTAQHKLGTVKYVLKEKRGSDHEPYFITAVTLNGEKIAFGDGGSKKIAEQKSAKKALEIIRKRKNIKC